MAQFSVHHPLYLFIWKRKLSIICINICDQICQKGSYTCAVSGLTFHGHLTDTTIDQQFMLVPLPKLQQSAFTEASFTGLSGIHGCSGGLLMASACPARQTDGRESPQDWLVRLGIDVATFWDVWSWKQPELKLFGHKKVFVSEVPATSWLPTTPHPPAL